MLTYQHRHVYSAIHVETPYQDPFTALLLAVTHKYCGYFISSVFHLKLDVCIISIQIIILGQNLSQNKLFWMLMVLHYKVRIYNQVFKLHENCISSSQNNLGNSGSGLILSHCFRKWALTQLSPFPTPLPLPNGGIEDQPYFQHG